jgi:hypothetical protein
VTQHIHSGRTAQSNRRKPNHTNSIQTKQTMVRTKKHFRSPSPSSASSSSSEDEGVSTQPSSTMAAQQQRGTGKQLHAFGGGKQLSVVGGGFRGGKQLQMA